MIFLPRLNSDFLKAILTASTGRELCSMKYLRDEFKINNYKFSKGNFISNQECQFLIATITTVAI